MRAVLAHSCEAEGGLRFVLAVTIMAAIILSLPTLTLAEGFNDGGYNFASGAPTSTYAGNAGLYVRDATHSATQTASFQGPHGGYSTTTNKCQDCHSTHYALGGYMLLRSADRHNACTFCHQGGGGSAMNIQMDNAYDATGVIATSTMGPGTGHTLGYSGLTAADIRPAFQDTEGFACFDCHTPHGNSQRVLTTFMDPGRKMDGYFVSAVYDVSGLVTKAADPAGIDIRTYNGGTGAWYGISVAEGNLVWSVDGTSRPEPVWPTGRFLLLKNPDTHDATDTVVGHHPGVDGEDLGTNKLPIDWDDPIGLGLHTEPFEESIHMLTVSEFCADCHDGAMGASTHVARVWRPDPSDTSTGAYADYYHHDSNPRLRDDMMYLKPGGPPDNPDGRANNYGNHCRKCHIGGSSCRQCHGIYPDGSTGFAYDRLMSPYDLPTGQPEHKSTYWAQPFIKHFAVAQVNGQCVDGGFTWPHRTLAVNLLKDELYGIDFDGTPVSPGEERRMSQSQIDAYLGLAAGSYFAGDVGLDESEIATDTWRSSPDKTNSITGQSAEALDSMCLDCHGDATYWNGDDPSYEYPEGWELILKGLP